MHNKKALALYQDSGDTPGFAGAACGLAMQLIRQGAFAEAVNPNDRALRAWHLVGREKYAACHLAFLGIILANIGKGLEAQESQRCFTQAVVLLSIADTHYPSDDDLLNLYGEMNRAEAEQILRSQLSADDYAAAWAEGQSMTLEEGIALAAKIAEAGNIQA